MIAPAQLPAADHVAAQILSETTVTVAEVAARLPGARAATRVHPATVTRWILTGARTPSGCRVRLEAARVGGRWITSSEAVARFVAALTAPATPPDPTPRTPPVRHRASEAAAAELDRLGIR
jgi:hypothetical protein